MTKITKIAVLGSGTMGSGIAGICANAGCEVLLLDMKQEQCEAAKARLAEGRAPVVQDAAALDRISTGSFDADLEKVAHCQWICEAIVEDLNIKRDLFQKLEAIRADGSFVTTNTSGIPLRSIYADMPKPLQRDIAVTHFFNPAHIMKLVELVPGQHTRAETIATLADFLGNRLSKGVVYAKDTVNFIGNRIGCFWMLAGLHAAEDALADGVGLETVDALTAAPLGFPATGLYGLIDLIGLDVMYNVGKNLSANLPADDLGTQYTAFPAKVQAMYERGQLGRKSGGGFYQLTRHDDGSKTMKVFDLSSEDWRAQVAAELPENAQNLRDLFAADSANGRFIRKLLGCTLYYAADLVPEIADDIVNVDRAMRWGFGWKQGPFEMLDALGADVFAKWCSENAMPIPNMLKILQNSAAESFYRNDGQEFLGVGGEWEKV